MAAKQTSFRKQVQELTFTRPIHNPASQFESLALDSQSDCVILAKLCNEGLVPVRLLMANQVSPDSLRGIIADDHSVSQIVAIPARKAEYIPLLKSWSIGSTTRYEAESWP